MLIITDDSIYIYSTNEAELRKFLEKDIAKYFASKVQKILQGNEGKREKTSEKNTVNDDSKK